LLRKGLKRLHFIRQKPLSQREKIKKQRTPKTPPSREEKKDCYPLFRQEETAQKRQCFSKDQGICKNFKGKNKNSKCKKFGLEYPPPSFPFFFPPLRSEKNQKKFKI